MVAGSRNRCGYIGALHILHVASGIVYSQGAAGKSAAV